MSGLARVRRLLLESSKQSIMWLLLLLVALFVAGMWILSSLNLEHSQRALAELRRAQIEQTFLAGLQRISARQRMLEQHTASLARIGEQFYHQWRLSGRLSAEVIAQTQRRNLEVFGQVLGTGLWFEPGVLGEEAGQYSPYLYHAGPEGRVRAGAADAQSRDYRQQPWYALAFGDAGFDASLSRDRLYWTPVYFNAQTDGAVLTLVAPIRSPEGEVVGMATTDWAAEQIIDLVSRIEVTPNSFSFLIDRNNRKLSSFSLEDARVADRIMEAIADQQLSAPLPLDYSTLLTATSGEQVAQTRMLEVEGREFLINAGSTPAGMLFGVGVPRDEIDAVLLPMRDSNYRILGLTGLILLLLAGWLIYRISLLMRQLQASYTDVLTGLPNRARLLQDLDRSRGATLALINLDRFRELNSLFGHECGDQVLCILAGRLRAFVDAHRRGSHVTLYRVTADEFALLGPALSHERLRALIEPLSEFLQGQRIHWQEQEIGIGATLGVACRRPGALGADSSSDGVRPDSLLSQATVALKSARDAHVSYGIHDASRQVERLYEENLVWARRLKAGLEENRILPWFQPIRNNGIARVDRFECLVRMEELDGSIVSPSKFLDVAHRLRLDRQITRIMIDKSFATFRNRPGDFSLNLSYADLLDESLLEFIEARLKSSGLGPRVVFEILESDGLGNYSEMRRFIERVKPWGCRIAIDDFGTGYSNFEHLLRLKVDLIKIDGSLIRHLHEDPTARLVTQGIVQFARSLGIATVAEFVHSEAVQQRVLELGIDFSQGSLVGMAEPLPILQSTGDTDGAVKER